VSVIAFLGGIVLSLTGPWSFAATSFLVGALFALASWKSAGRGRR
jgi:hypothetical protein